MRSDLSFSVVNDRIRRSELQDLSGERGVRKETYPAIRGIEQLDRAFPYGRQETKGSGGIHRSRWIPRVINDRGRLVKTLGRLNLTRPVDNPQYTSSGRDEKKRTGTLFEKTGFHNEITRRNRLET